MKKLKKEEEPLSFKEMLLEDEGVQEYIKRQQEERERFMMSMIKKHLGLYDRILFYFYRNLADRFAGGDRVKTLAQRGRYDETRFGIRIYGKDYWMEEKETNGYE